MDHTILDELEENSSGLGEETSRKYIFQVLRGIDFCHANNVSCKIFERFSDLCRILQYSEHTVEPFRH
jgi:serine/threonine protein kinase